jgi:hypothetical protein
MELTDLWLQAEHKFHFRQDPPSNARLYEGFKPE